MPIRFHCEACEARVKVPGGSEGRKVKCPRCGHMQRVPHHAREAVAVPVGGAPEELHDADGTGSYEAQTEEQEQTSDRMERIDVAAAASPPASPEVRTSTKNAPRKGGLDAGDSLAELADRFTERRDMTPSDVTARAMEKHEQQARDHHQPQAQTSTPAANPGVSGIPGAGADVSVKPAPRPMSAPPRAVPLAGWAARSTPARPAATASPAAAQTPAPPRAATPFVALRNLAVALRITPALLIPATLWHVLNTTTVSGAIVTIISGGAIVALTWAIAEIADAVRAMAIAQTA